MKNVGYICFCFLLSSCLLQKKTSFANNNANKYVSYPNVIVDTLNWLDSNRNRQIPIAIYTDKTLNNNSTNNVIIFSHGYGENKGGGYLTYSYLTKFLAANGYIVVSIQHELSTDSLLPMKGNIQQSRMPNWLRGVDNIYFVLQKLKTIYPNANFTNLTLIGHSNGGDMSMLFATKYPKLLQKVISLDNLRMALPRTFNPKVFSIRSSDKQADNNVIPTIDEQKQFNIAIVNLLNTTHNNMNNSANSIQRKEICDWVLQFLKD